MNSGLFYCVPKKMCLGYGLKNDVLAYDMNWLPNQSLEMNRILCTSKYIRDEFGDEYFQIDIEYQPSLGIPAIELRYRHRAGDTGFEFFRKNAYGDSSDPELQEFTSWLLKDAWVWSSRKDEFVSFENERENLAYPTDFLEYQVKGKNTIIVHSPFSQSAITEITDLLQGKHTITSILSVADQCEMVSIWRLTYGNNPILFSNNMSHRFGSISEKCAEMGLSLHKVESQSDLPEW